MSSTAGTIHSSYALYKSSQVFRLPFRWNSPNTQASIDMFAFTFAYFIFDAVFCYLVEYPGFLNFVLHHVASAAVVLTCSIAGYGHLTLCLWYFLGELSNAPQNVYLVAELLAEDGGWYSPAAGAAAAFLRPCFLLLFMVLRIVCSPPMYLWMFHSLVYPGAARFNKAAGRHTIPLWVALVWQFMVGGILVGSYLFINDNIHFLDDVLHMTGFSHWATVTAMPAPL